MLNMINRGKINKLNTRRKHSKLTSNTAPCYLFLSFLFINCINIVNK